MYKRADNRSCASPARWQTSLGWLSCRSNDSGLSRRRAGKRKVQADSISAPRAGNCCWSLVRLPPQLDRLDGTSPREAMRCRGLATREVVSRLFQPEVTGCTLCFNIFRRQLDRSRCRVYRSVALAPEREAMGRVQGKALHISRENPSQVPEVGGPVSEIIFVSGHNAVSV